MIRTQGGDDLVVKPGKEEHLVLDPRAANGEPAEFIIQAGHLGTALEPLLIIAESVQHRVVLITIHAAMPVVGARLGNQIDYRAGIAPVLRAELIGDHYILGDEFRVAYKQ